MVVVMMNGRVGIRWIVMKESLSVDPYIPHNRPE
jgi:hypothetical protein